MLDLNKSTENVYTKCDINIHVVSRLKTRSGMAVSGHITCKNPAEVFFAAVAADAADSFKLHPRFV